MNDPSCTPGRCLALAAAIALLCAAWLAAPWHLAGSARPWHVVVFDRSASVERTRPDHAQWIGATLEQERRLAQSTDAQFAALVFAGDRVWWQPPQAATRGGGVPPAVGDPLASDLAGAFELVHGAARDAGVAQGVVRAFSDGRATTAGSQAAARALAQAGLRVELLEPGAALLEDLTLVALRAPEQLEESAPLACELRVESTSADAGAPRRVRVQLELVGAGSARSQSFERTLAAGEAQALWRFDLGPAPAGGVRILARLALAGDPIPENDRASCWVAVGGALPIAVLDAGAGANFLTDPQRWPGLIFLPTSLEELPGRLAEARALITVDVDPLALPLPLLTDFVAAGGGWLHCAGERALRAADRGPEASAAARELLPLWPAAAPRPQRDVLLLVDGSGSMAGDKFEAVQAAALRLAGVVPARDRVWLGFFSSKLEPLRLLREADAQQFAPVDLAALIAEREPGGSTDIRGSLAQLARERTGEPREMLALLLSDGRDPTAAARPDLAPLRAQLAQARIALRAFAFGADAEREFLASLLPQGQSLTAVDDPAQLAQLVARAVDEERVRAGSSVVSCSADGFEPSSLAAEVAPALARATPRQLQRSWIAEADSRASVLWRTTEGDPLLVLRKLGLGHVAALASMPADGWAPTLGEPSVLGPLLRALARGSGVGRTALHATLEEGVLWVRGLPESTPARVQAELPDGTRIELTPPADVRDQPTRTRSATWNPSWTAPTEGLLVLRSTVGERLISVALDVPASREFSAPALALAAPRGPVEPGRSARSAHPAAPWVLAGGLGLLGAALFLGLERRKSPAKVQGNPTSRR